MADAGLLNRQSLLNTSPCDPSHHLQESPGPPGPKSQKSLKKGLLGGLQKSPKKYPKKSKNTNFRTFLGIFRLFRFFLGLFCRPPERPFLRLFCDFGPGGPGDSCITKWRLGSQTSPLEQSQTLRCRIDRCGQGPDFCLPLLPFC